MLVEDGGIVVLGGLIADEYQQSQERVPLLGDIPLVGNLFRNTARSRKKTNLMVFLRPMVLRDANASSQLSQDRYEAIRGAQQTVQPDANLLMRNVSGAAVLPGHAVLADTEGVFVADPSDMRRIADVALERQQRSLKLRPYLEAGHSIFELDRIV